MRTTMRPLLALAADDLMSRQVVLLPQHMPLRDAARLLVHNQIGGAPVVDEQGKCIGVLSAIDFLRLAGKRDPFSLPAKPPLPMTCSFVALRTGPDGTEVAQCSLPPGVCPLQARREGPDGEQMIQCSQPNCMLMDWQIVNVEHLPVEEVSRFMTPNPVMSRPETCLRTLARQMIDAHIHRIIVVDEDDHPVGIITSTDLLTALAFADDEL